MILFLLSHHGGLPAPFIAAAEAGLLRALPEGSLDDAALGPACGLIVTMHADQIALAERAALLDGFLARGGRILVNGHLLRPFVAGVSGFIPSGAGRLPDLALSPLAPHALFDGIPREAFQARRGVAGFYGRGHVPPPAGARPITGIGSDCAPLDWEWRHPGGGLLFCHAGNDLWTTLDDASLTARLARNICGWLADAALAERAA
ncbi:MAG: hypothetical protein NZM27_09720 [Acetobacteraceae bacterium]|nr:hypothetical protein [Acetobacteraceae bacterium]MCX7686319.1 hypothetical protein [Acetobacteraceae bacterium]MDW8398801.1 hypothetical protein [Acetobacteraceae bacterium]